MTRGNSLHQEIVDSFKTQSFSVNLDFLESLSKDAAGGLVHQKPFRIDLNGLQTLSSDAALELGKHKGMLLLNGINEMPELVAQGLSSCGVLFLNGLEYLSYESAVHLSQHRGGELHLDGLQGMDDAVAELLSNYKGYLSVSGRNLTPSAARLLCIRNGYLSVKSIQVVTEEIGRSFSQHQGHLVLSDIEIISDTAAKRLGEHRGDLTINCSGLLPPSFYAAVDSIENDLTLNVVHLSDHDAKCLGKHRGTLCLSSLAYMTGLVAEYLAQHDGDLYLPGLVQLNESQASHLSRHVGELNLNGLKELSLSQAKSLSQHKGMLRLEGLRFLNDDAAEALLDTECLALVPEQLISESAQEILWNIPVPEEHVYIAPQTMLGKILKAQEASDKKVDSPQHKSAKKREPIEVARLVHCDWGADDTKRAMCTANKIKGLWHIADLGEAGEPSTLLGKCRDQLSELQRVIVGFDFPIGHPYAFGEKAELGCFIDALKAFGKTKTKWKDFFTKTDNHADVCIHRPFYPRTGKPKGTTSRDMLAKALDLSWQSLHRECEKKTSCRSAASPLFWTLGPQSVGTAAICGWREILQPLIDEENRKCKIWPFEGDIGSIIEEKCDAIVETYPGEAYSHLGFPQKWKGKTNQKKRKEVAEYILSWAVKHDVTISKSIKGRVRDGFGPASSGEDPFDSLVGVCSMIAVVEGHRPASPDFWGAGVKMKKMKSEGWIFGQQRSE